MKTHTYTCRFWVALELLATTDYDYIVKSSRILVRETLMAQIRHRVHKCVHDAKQQCLTVVIDRNFPSLVARVSVHFWLLLIKLTLHFVLEIKCPQGA